MFPVANEDELIREYASKAPVDIKALIGRLGVAYVERDMPPEESGYIEYDGLMCVIAVNANDGLQRKRFTAAHELAHFLLHRDLLRKRKHLDRLFGEAARRNPSAPLEHAHEVQANQYASRLLMPKATIDQQILNGVTDLRALANLFLVSEEAMRFRLKNLGWSHRVADNALLPF
jgi:Zn-dependent peptidase ImmA (M78 family)